MEGMKDKQEIPDQYVVAKAIESFTRDLFERFPESRLIQAAASMLGAVGACLLHDDSEPFTELYGLVSKFIEEGLGRRLKTVQIVTDGENPRELFRRHDAEKAAKASPSDAELETLLRQLGTITRKGVGEIV